MRIVLHIGLPGCGAERLQSVMDDKRGQLAKAGILVSGLARKNHTKLYMAVTEPGHVDPLRHARGFGPNPAQAALAKRVREDLMAEVTRHAPDVLVLSSHQLATLPNSTEIQRLRALLLTLSDQIEVVAHVDEPSRLLLAHFTEQVLVGRRADLTQELDLIGADRWRAASLKSWTRIVPGTHDFPEVQAPPHWIDLAELHENWSGVFGADSVTFRAHDPNLFASERATDEVIAMLGIDANIGKANVGERTPAPSSETLARARQLNIVFGKLMEKGRIIPRQLWSRFMTEIEQPGPPLDPGSLSALSAFFAPRLAPVIDRFPAIETTLTAPPPALPYAEAEPTLGYRATQYAAAALPRIDAFTAEYRRQQEDAAKARANGARPDGDGALTPVAEELFTPRAKENFHHLRSGRFAPHNRLGRVNEEEIAAAFTEEPMRDLPDGRSGNVIVGCMKNEAPYILEWVAYHRMIGVDHFLIYTNDCTDGTAELLDRLQELGILQHRDNTVWKGNSPQQYALNKALKEPVIQNADWVIHIDVDEFINVRCGNGTLDDFFERVPDATNVAMTWRLFGHNGVTKLADDLVIDQFDDAAPKYCPKPHTAWGFKTMTKNIGAYEKFSCHRPNKLDEAHRDAVQWVNGSGQVMTEKYKENGWRSDLKTIGYDLLQLNHYALRSAESFLIKRQRGRALHVDRSIGINYWVRMDWGGNRDVTIKRNIPRVRAEIERLLEDDTLREIHEAGFAWHKAKAAELHETPEFQELYDQALSTKLTEMERVAFALALDMES
ncbi:glycosyltransferase family 2 protein [Maritimibacter dapengensis]|uniref:Glycosyltransferase family 2 protein n=1 Tax=Maritimibacter dapengensis TaxID=2836868 RepID=A0ABS6SZT9_9RHOB|nr:glycosyltransferase family 2 protein [Maritimibacter dapengensis]MBV7378374.1 glycosyltransferase family 2 protein [Maritimibacter dapengensis]